jgi:hypothetical protein
LSLRGRRVVIVDPDLLAGRRLELLAPVALGTVAAVRLSALLSDPAISRPCLGIRRRWNSTEPAYEDFLRHPHRAGYVVDRARFDRGSLRAAAVAAGVEFVKARVAGVEADGRGVCLAIDGAAAETLPFPARLSTPPAAPLSSRGARVPYGRPRSHGRGIDRGDIRRERHMRPGMARCQQTGSNKLVIPDPRRRRASAGLADSPLGNAINARRNPAGPRFRKGDQLAAKLQRSNSTDSGFAINPLFILTPPN